jgi:hypothetical protein
VSVSVATRGAPFKSKSKPVLESISYRTHTAITPNGAARMTIDPAHSIHWNKAKSGSVPRLRRLLPAVLLGLAAPAAALQEYEPGNYPSSGAGTLSLTVVPATDAFPFGTDRLLLRATASKGDERFEIHVVAEDLLVVRDSQRCVRSAVRTPHHFRKGVPCRLSISWNRESTRLTVDGKSAGDFNLMVIDEFSWNRPSLGVAEGDDLNVTNVSASATSGTALNPSDAAFVRNNQCPSLSDLFDSQTQESYRGVAFHRFPDAASRDRLKTYLDLLPPPVLDAVKHVIYVDESRYPAFSWRGRAYFQSESILLEAAASGDPRVFFHECAHLYDHAAFRSRGCFLNEAWKAKFMPAGAASGQPVESSSLDAMDGSPAAEELAEFSGIAFAALVSPVSPNSQPLPAAQRSKVQFLLDIGMITPDQFSKLVEEAH